MTIKEIYFKYRIKISLTLFIVLLEGLLMILFPLFIGRAIESTLNKEMEGLYALAGLSLAVLVIGAGRRFYDTRIYAKIYEELALKISKNRGTKSNSKVVSHVTLLEEIVEFFENSVPELISSIIGVVGILIIVSTLNVSIFLACLLSFIGITLIYIFSRKKTLRFNSNYNDEFEQHERIINHAGDKEQVNHFKNMMKWNIKLSDLGTINFSLVWLVLAVLLCGSIILSTNEQNIQFGAIFSLIMYVYQFIENAMNLPHFYQQTLRLKDISSRIEATTKEIE